MNSVYRNCNTFTSDVKFVMILKLDTEAKFRLQIE